MTYKNLLSELKGQVLYITINRESKLNALNRETIQELAEVVKTVYNRPEIRAVLLSGAGQKAFVAGADISEFSNFNADQGRSMALAGHQDLFDAIAACPKPFVAAINGFALGGGLELAMACHIRLAADSAKMGLPEVTLGLIPGYGGTQRLTQLVGRGRALEMICTADMISAEKALQIGLVNAVFPAEQLLAGAEALLSKICSRAPLAVGAAIRAVNAALDPELSGFDVEIDEFGNCFKTWDFKEGVSAFLEKRKPLFKGE